MKKEIFLIPYSHLDTQWRWEYPTTINKYIKNTLDESIYMFEKYPEHQFNFTGALRYQMMKEYFPEKYLKIKDYIKENRWHLAGTCLDETDALIPSTESMVRNILYGDRWQKDEFGKSSRDYMIPDCFGFPANMPTILKHCGIEGFSSNKLTWNSAIGIPFELGKWKGPDNSEIISAFNPCRYDSHLELPIYWNPGRQKRLNNLGKKNNIWKSFQYYGVGDIGGAPKEGSVKRAISSMNYYNKKNGDLVVKQGSADQFFSEITEDEKQKMDTYQGDLLLVNHSAGTLTSEAIMKRWNRKNEQLAFAAEAAAVMAKQIAGVPYPTDKIKSAWYRVIGSQMHDIIPGTSTPTAYEYSQNDEVVALKTWNTIIEDSIKEIAPHIIGDGKILVFNPLSEERNDLVTIQLNSYNQVKGKYPVVKDAFGKVIESQIEISKENMYTLTFKPELKPFSISKYSLEYLDEVQKVQQGVTIKEELNNYVMENEHLKVCIDNKGIIYSIFLKDTNRELLKKPLAYELQKERPFKFPAWNMDWRDRKKKPFIRIEEGNNVEIIEHGALRSTIKITTKYQSSTLIKEVSLSKDSTIVEFKERINWREKGCSLKLAFNPNMDNPQTTYNWETSRINRGVNHKKMFEVPSRLWVDMSEEDFGFSILEDSKYGYDRPDENTLRMTLLFTPAIWYFNGFWDQRTQDWGNHTVRYALYPHNGDWKNTDVKAKQFNHSVRTFNIEQLSKEEKQYDYSFVKTSTSQVGIQAVKKAEDNDGIIVRIYERHGKDVKAILSFAEEIENVSEVNGLEEIIKGVSFNQKQFSLDIEANGIKSYLISFKGIKEKLVKQQQLSLDYNVKMIGRNLEEGLFPRELMPSKIESGLVEYHISNSNSNNALLCNKQRIEIPKGFNRISMLIGAKEETKDMIMWFDNNDNLIKEENVVIPSMTKFLGLWDTRIWKRKPKHHLKDKRDYAWLNPCIDVKDGYIIRDRLEWYSTHIHKNGMDDAYKYGYIFTINLDIPDNATSMMLPPSSDIYIFAMTVSNQSSKISSSQYLIDNFDF